MRGFTVVETGEQLISQGLEKKGLNLARTEINLLKGINIDLQSK